MNSYGVCDMCVHIRRGAGTARGPASAARQARPGKRGPASAARQARPGKRGPASAARSSTRADALVITKYELQALPSPSPLITPSLISLTLHLQRLVYVPCRGNARPWLLWRALRG
jgi:hypothetical protein